MAVLGMRGTGNFGAVEEPENWRQGILLYFPNGDAPLTAFLSKMREQPTDDPTFTGSRKDSPSSAARSGARGRRAVQRTARTSRRDRRTRRTSTSPCSR